MTHNVETLRLWIHIATAIAAACTTSVPVLYSFFPWRSRLLGRLFMLQACSFAAAMDLSTVLQLWKPTNVLLAFWTDVIVITAIAVSTLLMAIFMWRLSHQKKRDVDATDQASV